MKKTTMLMLFALCAAACSKEMRVSSAQEFSSEEEKEICFDVNYGGAFIATKITEVNRDNLASFNLMATTGSAGAETQQWSVTATKNASSGQYTTGKYWPSTDPSYHFYASNAPLNFSADGPWVTVDSSSDVVCTSNYSPNYNDVNSLTLSHILARVGNVEVTSANGYEVGVGGISVLETRTSGTYNVRTSTWSGQSGAASAPLTVGDNDYLLLPGSYTIQVTYTLTKGDYTGTFTNSGEVALVAGKTSNIKVNLAADPAVPLNFTVSVEAWEVRNVRMTLP